MADKNGPSPDKTSMNRLVHDKSPYLLQHAHNPVDWYPWSAEAFERAAAEDKPIFLSIGYSTCHWCHVMAHESFEDAEVARLMNDLFVSIKVDREERPDIDGVYMTVCQMLTGSGGWPLTIIMTPDRKPFFAATYLPKRSIGGRIGMLELIPRIREVWQDRREEVVRSTEEIMRTLHRASRHEPGEHLDEAVLTRAYEQLARRYDVRHGGFGGAPKFPTPHNFLFLLRYWQRSGVEMARQMVEKTLEAIRLGGVYDQVGFGVHRYSTDALWLVPHFEKMLYDQALMAMAYIEAYQATGKRFFADTAHEIFAYVLRDMTDPQGGFYSAEDADSEGVEGKFYVWTVEELRNVLPPEDADLAVRFFNVREEGNFAEEATGHRTGANILHMRRPLEAMAGPLEMTEETLRDRLERVRQRLFEHREQRVRPHRDDKILTDWNGLMIAALAKGARVLDEPRYAAAAERAVEFVGRVLRGSDGRLLHRYRDGDAGIAGMVDDHAFLVWGLLELYETTFAVDHLQTALETHRDLMGHFWDSETGGFFTTADDGEQVLVRQKEIYDGAVPSGNSVAMWNLLRLARLTGNTEWEEKAAAIAQVFANTVARAPSGFSMLMVGLDFNAGPAYEVVIAGDPTAADTRSMLQSLRLRFLPRKVVALRPTGDSPEITRIAAYTREQRTIDGRATAYVCRDFACRRPTTDIEEMLAALGGSHQNEG
jgi:uncharacterized protein YyaL (SSP411 family)